MSNLIWDHSLKTSANFHDFWPLPPTIDIPSKCLWRGFLILMFCDLWTIGTWGHPSLSKACWRLKWMVPFSKFIFQKSSTDQQGEKWSLVFNLPLTYYRVKDVKVTVSFRKFTAKFHEFSISNSESKIFTIVLFLIWCEEKEINKTWSDWSRNRVKDVRVTISFQFYIFTSKFHEFRNPKFQIQ